MRNILINGWAPGVLSLDAFWIESLEVFEILIAGLEHI